MPLCFMNDSENWSTKRHSWCEQTGKSLICCDRWKKLVILSWILILSEMLMNIDYVRVWLVFFKTKLSCCIVQPCLSLSAISSLSKANTDTEDTCPSNEIANLHTYMLTLPKIQTAGHPKCSSTKLQDLQNITAQ